VPHRAVLASDWLRKTTVGMWPILLKNSAKSPKATFSGSSDYHPMGDRRSWAVLRGRVCEATAPSTAESSFSKESAIKDYSDRSLGIGLAPDGRSPYQAWRRDRDLSDTLPHRCPRCSNPARPPLPFAEHRLHGLRHCVHDVERCRLCLDDRS